MKWLFLVVGICFLVSCGKSVDRSPSCPKQCILKMCFDHTPSTIDPRQSGDLAASTIAFMIFDGLTHVREDGTIDMSLAKSYKLSDDQTTYTFELRDAKWSDGVAITAHDFEYSWKKILDPEFPSMFPNLFYPIRNAREAAEGKCALSEVGVRALDDKTLVVELNYPTPYFLDLTSFCIFFPVPKHIDEADPKWFTKLNDPIVCSGPFKLDAWENEQKFQVTRNETFWNSSRVKLDGILVHIVRDPMSVLQLYEQGQIDLVSNSLTSFPLDALLSLVRSGQMHSTPAGNTVFTAFNVNSPWLKSIHLRKALSYAIDRESIVTHVTQMNETPATQVIPPPLTRNEIVPILSKNMDRLKAEYHLKEAIQELNLPGGELPTLTLIGPPIEFFKKIGEALQQQWQSVLGVKVNIDFAEKKTFMENLHQKNFDIGLYAWWAQYPDPMNVFERFCYSDSIKNYSGWQSTPYLTLLDQILRETDVDKRLGLVREAEKVLIDEMPISPVLHFNTDSMQQPYVHGVEISSIGDIQFRYASLHK